MVGGEHSFDVRLLVVPLKASIKTVKLIREGRVAGWWGGVGGFVVSYGLDALPNVLFLKCSSILSLWLCLAFLMPLFRSALDEL